MSLDAQQRTALQTRLDEADRHFSLGDFESVLDAVAAVLHALEGQPAADNAALERRALMLRVRSLSKFERFDDMLQGCARLLDLMSLHNASADRAELMVQMAFVHVNLGMPEQSLRAAHVALQDALQLKAPTLSSKALERAAMAYLSMGDGLEAERFMVEAVGFVEQEPSLYERMRRYSNALHLVCGLHDAYAEAGNLHMARGVLGRALRVLELGDALVVQEPSAHMQCMWRANQARWRRRQGDSVAARAALQVALRDAAAQQWHSIRRSVQLELAVMDAAAGETEAALGLLSALFEPTELRVRDHVALPALALRARLHAERNEPDLAAQVSEDLARRQAARVAAVRRAQAQLPGLGARILEALAEADRARVDDEIRRLRRLHDLGQGVRVAGSEWWPAAEPAAARD